MTLKEIECKKECVIYIFLFSVMSCTYIDKRMCLA